MGEVRRSANIVVTDGTGAGKSTLPNVLAAAIPAPEWAITVEDAAELRLPGEHVVRLEARPANADGLGAVTVRSAVRNTLRMRPDRATATIASRMAYTMPRWCRSSRMVA